MYLSTYLYSLKLNQLSKAELEKKEMSYIRGGDCSCNCACGGSSSTTANSGANLSYGVSGGGSYGSGGGICWSESTPKWQSYN